MIHIQYNGCTSDYYFRRIVWLLFLATFLLYLYASLSLLAYYADSAHYLLSIIVSKSFRLVEPPSKTVQIMQQLPLVLSLHIGIRDIYTLSVVFGLTLLLLPLAELILCYIILPNHQKLFIIFPLLQFYVGTGASLFPVVTEAPIAAGFFWILFYLILFRTKSLKNLFLVLIISVPALYLHESMVFLAPILALSLIPILVKEKNNSPFSMIICCVLIVWFLFISAVDLNFIINPRDPVNRHGFLQHLLYLKWIYSKGINTTTLFGFIFFLFIIFLQMQTKYIRLNTVRIKLPFLFGFICMCIFILTIFDVHFYGVFTQFAARANSTLLSFPLALVALWITHYRPKAIKIWGKRDAHLLVALLGIAILATHTIGIHKWSGYIHDIKTIVNTEKGIIPQDEIMRVLPDDRRQIFKIMSWSWTYPTLSYLLSENGRVNSVILNRPTSYQPFNPCNPEELPKNDLFDTEFIIKFVKTNGCSE